MPPRRRQSDRRRGEVARLNEGQQYLDRYNSNRAPRDPSRAERAHRRRANNDNIFANANNNNNAAPQEPTREEVLQDLADEVTKVGALPIPAAEHRNVLTKTLKINVGELAGSPYRSSAVVNGKRQYFRSSYLITINTNKIQNEVDAHWQTADAWKNIIRTVLSDKLNYQYRKYTYTPATNTVSGIMTTRVPRDAKIVNLAILAAEGEEGPHLHRYHWHILVVIDKNYTLRPDYGKAKNAIIAASGGVAAYVNFRYVNINPFLYVLKDLGR